MWNWEEVRPYADNAMFVGRRIVEGGITIKLLAVRVASDSGAHTHPYDQWVHVRAGKVAIVCGETEHRLVDGSVLRIPANALHAARFEAGCELIEIGLGLDP